jgi:hypothetical protein
MAATLAAFWATSHTIDTFTNEENSAIAKTNAYRNVTEKTGKIAYR